MSRIAIVDLNRASVMQVQQSANSLKIESIIRFNGSDNENPNAATVSSAATESGVDSNLAPAPTSDSESTEHDKPADAAGIAQQPHPTDLGIAEKLAPFFAENSSDIDHTLSLYPASSTSTRLLPLPFSDPRRIDQVIGFELEALVPFSSEDLVLTWLPTSQEEDKGSLSFTSFTPKEKLQAHLDTLGECGLNPRVVASALTALMGLAGLAGSAESASSTAGDESNETGSPIESARAVCLASESQTHVLVLSAEGNPAAYRCIPATGNQALPQMMALFESLPRQFLPQGLEAYGDRVIEETLASLSLKTNIQCRYHQAQAVLEREAIEVDPSIELQDEDLLALGLLNAYQRSPRRVPMNFRVGDYAYSGDFAQYRADAISLGIGLAAVLVLALLSFVVRSVALSAQEERIDDAFCQLTQKTTGERICNADRALQALANPGISAGLEMPNYGADLVFEALSMAIPTDVDTEFKDLTFKTGVDNTHTITGSATAGDFQMVERVKTELSALTCFQKVETSNQSSKNERVEYDFSAKVQCPPGKTPIDGLEVVTAATPPPPKSSDSNEVAAPNQKDSKPNRREIRSAPPDAEIKGTTAPLNDTWRRGGWKDKAKERARSRLRPMDDSEAKAKQFDLEKIHREPKADPENIPSVKPRPSKAPGSEN